MILGSRQGLFGITLAALSMQPMDSPAQQTQPAAPAVQQGAAAPPQPPAAPAQAPPPGAQPPAAGAQPPAAGAQPPAAGVQPPAARVQPPAAAEPQQQDASEEPKRLGRQFAAPPPVATPPPKEEPQVSVSVVSPQKPAVFGRRTRGGMQGIGNQSQDTGGLGTQPANPGVGSPAE
jgi:hypothetical protein